MSSPVSPTGYEPKFARLPPVLTDSNYSTWKFQMEAILRGHGVFESHCLKPPVSKPELEVSGSSRRGSISGSTFASTPSSSSSSSLTYDEKRDTLERAKTYAMIVSSLSEKKIHLILSVDRSL